jgi:hypothetical protein
MTVRPIHCKRPAPVMANQDDLVWLCGRPPILSEVMCHARQRNHGALRGMTSMAFDLDLIFPIRDVASADLMMLKATCLWNAGIIDDRQRKLVQQRAARFSAGKRNRCWKFPDCRNAYPTVGFVLRSVVLELRRMASARALASVALLKIGESPMPPGPAPGAQSITAARAHR